MRVTGRWTSLGNSENVWLWLTLDYPSTRQACAWIEGLSSNRSGKVTIDSAISTVECLSTGASVVLLVLMLACERAPRWAYWHLSDCSDLSPSWLIEAPGARQPRSDLKLWSYEKLRNIANMKLPFPRLGRKSCIFILVTKDLEEIHKVSPCFSQKSFKYRQLWLCLNSFKHFFVEYDHFLWSMKFIYLFSRVISCKVKERSWRSFDIVSVNAWEPCKSELSSCVLRWLFLCDRKRAFNRDLRFAPEVLHSTRRMFRCA